MGQRKHVPAALPSIPIPRAFPCPFSDFFFVLAQLLLGGTKWEIDAGSPRVLLKILATVTDVADQARAGGEVADYQGVLSGCFEDVDYYV